MWHGIQDLEARFLLVVRSIEPFEIRNIPKFQKGLDVVEISISRELLWEVSEFHMQKVNLWEKQIWDWWIYDSGVWSLTKTANRIKSGECFY